ncbi:MAG TPA: class I SAM-dependent methyltransferase [Solirubrobacterales bacterium]
MSRSDFYASPFGAIYSAYMGKPRLSRPIGRALWGGDPGRYYESMEAIGEVREGGTIVDCPCGAGAAFRGLHPNRSVRYVAADLSPSMLRRARRNASRRGLANVEFVEADATTLPLPDGSANLFLSLWGLHCFADPGGAMVEAARVLEPGGRLVGASFVAGREGLRQRLLIRPGLGDFGRVGAQPQIEAWLEAAGFGLTQVDRSGPMMFFDATIGAG